MTLQTSRNYQRVLRRVCQLSLFHEPKNSISKIPVAKIWRSSRAEWSKRKPKLSWSGYFSSSGAIRMFVGVASTVVGISVGRLMFQERHVAAAASKKTIPVSLPNTNK